MNYFSRRDALQKWKQRNGSSATYSNLIATFEKAGHNDFAVKVCEIAGKLPGNVLLYCV